MMSRRTRQRMVDRLGEKGITNKKILEVMANVPRHIFLDEALAHRAYDDVSLPIGYGQTLSQPWVVARMTELLLSLGRPEKVLEIGTGSGYQTAVLSPLVDRVVTVERIAPLQRRARQRHYDLKCNNIRYHHSDGEFGLSREAPYNAIISTAAPERIPQSLLDQLAPDGVLVIPVGTDQQQLHFVYRDGDSDQFVTNIIEPVHFVPLVAGELVHS
ncbi:protein-L-isoaspartate(D-aspartate) O-methyltransferase [Umboniibacter marinipuniceus]|nr:protein-L-isoaspartate(D-aspartate) O-methyltransferase [Umboniibacter marinipuniceus]